MPENQSFQGKADLFWTGSVEGAQKPMTMAQLKKNTARLPDEALLARAEFVITSLAANVAMFPMPNPSVAVLRAATDLFRSTMVAAEDGGRSAHQAKRDAKAALKARLDQAGSYVSNVASGNAQVILAGGYEVKHPRAPLGLFPAPVIISAAKGQYEGTVDLLLERMKGVVCYMVYMTSDDPSQPNARWQYVMSTTRCRNTISGLQRFKMYAFCATAMGTAGESPRCMPVLGRAA